MVEQKQEMFLAGLRLAVLFGRCSAFDEKPSVCHRKVAQPIKDWWMRIQTTRTKMAVKIFIAIGSVFHIITIQTSSPHAGWKLWSWAHIVLFKVSYKFIYHYSLWSCRKDFAKIWTKKLRNVIHRQAWHAEACLEPYRHWWCPYIIGYLKSEADELPVPSLSKMEPAASDLSRGDSREQKEGNLGILSNFENHIFIG